MFNNISRYPFLVKRIISEKIIYYNYLYLSKTVDSRNTLYEYRERRERLRDDNNVIYFI